MTTKAKAAPSPIAAPTHSDQPREVLEAEQELERYTRVEQELLAELEVLVTRLEQSEGEVGDRILKARLSPEAEDLEGINQEHSRLWLAVDTTRRALRSAGKAKAYAQANILTARAHEKRREAETLLEEVRERMTLTAHLLDQLTEHEGARFYAPPPADPSGVGYAINKPATRSQELSMKAADLLKEAGRLEEEAIRVRARAETEYARPIGQ